jgi:hypothetical protein
MANLRGLTIGSGDAESESDLPSYFYETPDYNAIKNREKQIILGGRGSGKSALFRMLSTNLPDASTVVVPLTPDDNSWKRLKGFAKDWNKDIPDIAKQWEFLVLTQVLDFSWERSSIRKTKAASQFRAELAKSTDESLFKSVHGKDRLPFIIDAARTILAKIPFSIELSGGFFKISARTTPEKTGSVDLALHRATFVTQCYDLLRDIIPNETHVYVLIDDLDLFWNGSDEEINSLSGLFAATQKIREKLGNKLSLVIFIRTDMYERLNWQHAVKDFARKLEIKWDSELLNIIIEKRLNHFVRTEQSQSLDDTANRMRDRTSILHEIFENGRICGRNAKTFLAESIVPRPRDVVFFISAAIKQAADRGRDVITKSDSERAFNLYSAWRRDVIINEWQYEHDFVSELVNSFIRKPAVWTLKDINQHLDQFKKDHEIPTGTRRLTKPGLLKDLLNWGVVGRRTGRSADYTWDRDSVQDLMPGDEGLMIHRSLWPVLAIASEGRGTSRQRQETVLDG